MVDKFKNSIPDIEDMARSPETKSEVTPFLK